MGYNTCSRREISDELEPKFLMFLSLYGYSIPTDPEPFYYLRGLHWDWRIGQLFNAHYDVYTEHKDILISCSEMKFLTNLARQVERSPEHFPTRKQEKWVQDIEARCEALEYQAAFGM